MYIKVKIIGKWGQQQKIHNLPIISKVVGIIPRDFDSTTAERDLIVETTSELLKHVYVISEIYLPLQYALIFPRGKLDYTDDIYLHDDFDPTLNKRQKISMKEFVVYRIQ